MEEENKGEESQPLSTPSSNVMIAIEPWETQKMVKRVNHDGSEEFW